jgi:hypothetical protein
MAKTGGDAIDQFTGRKTADQLELPFSANFFSIIYWQWNWKICWMLLETEECFGTLQLLLFRFYPGF